MNDVIVAFLRGDYMPHGHCYLWQPGILWTHVISDLLIAVSYFSIPAALFIFMQKRQDIGYQPVFSLFGLFILLCGITHLVAIVTVWQGIYGFHALTKLATAIVSVLTATYLFKLLPELSKIPTPAQYDFVAKRLDEEYEKRKELQKVNADLALYRFISNHVPTPMVILDTNNSIRLANRHFYRLFDLQDEILTGRHIDQVLPLMDERKVEQHVEGMEGEYHEFNARCRTNAGQELTILVHLDKKDIEQESLCLLTVQDLSEGTQTKRALTQSQQRFERVANATVDGVWEWHIPSDKVWYSPIMLEMLGAQPKEELCNTELWYRHAHPDYQQQLKQAMHRCATERGDFAIEYLGLNKDEDYSWYLARGRCISESEGEAQYITGALTDLHEIKSAQLLLKKNNDFLQSIFEGTSHGIFVLNVYNDKFVFSSLNKAVLDYLGVRLGQIQFKTVHDLVPNVLSKTEADQIYKRYQTCVDARKEATYVEKLTLSDKTRWFKTNLYPLIDDDGKVYQLIGSTTDISKQKNNEAKLKHEQEFSKRLLNNSLCGLYIFDFSENRNVMINQRYTDITGYTLDDLKSMDNTLALFHPEDREQVIAHMQEVQTLTTDEFSELQYRFKHKAGHWIWCHSYDSLLTIDEQGNPIQMLGSFMDISALKDYALRLEESNNALEQFAYVASHDLQEPLRKLSAFAEGLQTKLGDELQEDHGGFELNRIVDAASRMREMIRDLLTLSKIRRDQLNLVNVSLTELTAEACDNLSIIIKEQDAKINQQQDAYLCVDRTLFVLLLQNLFTNAIKFRQQQLPPKIILNVEQFSDEEGNLRVKIHVRDNGMGFEEKFAEEIFMPFKRLVTRAQSAGSGIGLAVVKRIIDVHGGQVHCQSQPGKGSCFTLELPGKLRPLEQ